MKNKLISYSIEEVIKANLDTQTVQKTLREKFGLLKSSFDVLTNSRYISNYLKWPEQKRNEFLVTIGGRVNFKKAKFYIEGKIQNENR